MHRDVKQWISRCHTCQHNKLRPGFVKYGDRQIFAATRRHEIVHMDLVGPLPESTDGFRYLLTIQDRFTKYIRAIPLVKADAPAVALGFINHWIYLFGTPEKVITDRGSEFISGVMNCVHRVYDIKKIHTVAYHPEGNGSIERFHRVMKTYLRCFFQDSADDILRGCRWQYVIPAVCAAYNSAHHTAINTNPHKAMFCEDMRQPADLKMDTLTSLKKGAKEHVKDWLVRMEEIHKAWTEHVKKWQATYDEKRRKKMNKGRLPHPYKIGDIVSVRTDGYVGNKKKFTRRYTGKYEILRIRENTVDLKELTTDLPRKTVVEKIVPFRE